MSISEYGGSNTEARLTEFKHPDPGQDSARLSYIRIIPGPGTTTDMASIFGDISEKNLSKAGINPGTLTTLKQQLTGYAANEVSGVTSADSLTVTRRYTKFILSNLQTNRVEKSQIIQTFGDTFATIFTGRQPNVLTASGHLVFDYESSNAREVWSWYHAFINAYEYYLRASRLAKWRVQVRLAVPDLANYDGYMIGLNESLAAENDLIIPFSFSMLLSSPPVVRPMLTSEAMPSVGNVEMFDDFTTAFTPGTTVTYVDGKPAVALTPLAPTDSTPPPLQPASPTTITALPPKPPSIVSVGDTAMLSDLGSYDQYLNFDKSIRAVAQKATQAPGAVTSYDIKRLQSTVKTASDVLQGTIDKNGRLLGKRYIEQDLALLRRTR